MQKPKQTVPPPRPVKRPEPTIPEQIAELLARALACLNGTTVRAMHII